MDLRRTHFREVLPTLSGKRLEVLLALQQFGPCTPRELAERMNWDKCSTRPRLTELRAMGRVQVTGQRRNGEHVMLALVRVGQMELLTA